MDCAATLDVDMVQSPSEEEAEDETDSAEVWGRLFPIGKGFVPQGMTRALLVCLSARVGVGAVCVVYLCVQV